MTSLAVAHCLSTAKCVPSSADCVIALSTVLKVAAHKLPKHYIVLIAFLHIIRTEGKKDNISLNGGADPK